MSYGEYVALLLNAPRIRILRLTDMTQAFEIAMGKKETPDSWIELVTDDQEERAKWKREEFKKSLPSRNRNDLG